MGKQLVTVVGDKLAAYLFDNDFEPTQETEYGGRVCYIFPQNKELMDAIRESGCGQSEFFLGNKMYF